MNERLTEAENVLPNLQKKVASAEAEKEKILDQFALGSVNQAELDRAMKALEKTKTEEAETGELIDALERVKGNLNREIPMFQNRILSFERVVWSWVRDREVLKLRNLIGRGLVKGYSAQLKTGLGDWNEFLKPFLASILNIRKYWNFNPLWPRNIKLTDWNPIRPAFLLLNCLGRILSGGGSLLIQISIKFDPNPKRKIEDQKTEKLISYHPKGRMMISKGIFPLRSEKPFSYWMP